MTSMEYIYSKTVILAHLVSKVKSAVLKKKLLMGRSEYLKNQFLHPFPGYYFTGCILQLAVKTQFRRLANLQMKVTCLGFDSSTEIFVQLRLVLIRPWICIDSLFTGHKLVPIVKFINQFLMVRANLLLIRSTALHQN